MSTFLLVGSASIASIGVIEIINSVINIFL